MGYLVQTKQIHLNGNNVEDFIILYTFLKFKGLEFNGTDYQRRVKKIQGNIIICADDVLISAHRYLIASDNDATFWIVRSGEFSVNCSENLKRLRAWFY